MIIEKCITCQRSVKEHYYVLGARTTIEPKPGKFVTLLETGWYPLYTKWTANRISWEKFLERFCHPHRLVRIRVEVGNY